MKITRILLLSGVCSFSVMDGYAAGNQGEDITESSKKVTKESLKVFESMDVKNVENEAENNLHAQVYLGNYYYKNEKYESSFKWFYKAAEQGNVNAQAFVAYFYKNGLGAQQNDSKEFEWLEKASKQDPFNYGFQMGILYYKKQLYKDAFESWQAVQNKDDGLSSYLIGLCYEKGKGVEQNLEKAYKYFQLADKESIKDANIRLVKYHDLGIIFDKNMHQRYKKALEDKSVYKYPEISKELKQALPDLFQEIK